MNDVDAIKLKRSEVLDKLAELRPECHKTYQGQDGIKLRETHRKGKEYNPNSCSHWPSEKGFQVQSGKDPVKCYGCATTVCYAISNARELNHCNLCLNFESAVVQTLAKSQALVEDACHNLTDSGNVVKQNMTELLNILRNLNIKCGIGYEGQLNESQTEAHLNNVSAAFDVKNERWNLVEVHKMKTLHAHLYCAACFDDFSINRTIRRGLNAARQAAAATFNAQLQSYGFVFDTKHKLHLQ